MIRLITTSYTEAATAATLPATITKTKERRAVNVWPDNPMGYGAEGMKYRFQWNFPIFFSPHNPKKLYAASNHLHMSTDEGASWEIISPDLSRNDPSKLGPSGGPITKDNTGVEYYCTVFAALESPYEEGLLWAGSDDGLIHLSRDGGKNWTNVTPSQMPEWSMINSVEADPFNKGGLFVAATRYKLGDYKPYLYHTTDYGQSWTLIVNGIAKEHFTRALRADPVEKGLLYAGTESGMYVSHDNGQHWHPFQLNLPIVPITDLHVKGHHLIAATQGRSLWMIDDLSPIRQLNKDFASYKHRLFAPAPAYRMGGGQYKKVKKAGLNHPGGAMIYFYLNYEEQDSIDAALSFYEKGGDLIRSFSTKAKEKKDKLKIEPGSNTFVWDLRYPDAEKFKDMILWWGSLKGPKAVPGEYEVELAVGTDTIRQSFEVLKDPRSTVSVADIQQQFDFVHDINTKVTEAHTAIQEIREIRKQLKHFTSRWKGDEEKEALIDASNEIDSIMTSVEKELYQTQNKSAQDPLNFPIKLTNKLAHLNSLMGMGDFPPTAQAITVKNELVQAIDEQLAIFNAVKEERIPAFNKMVQKAAVDAVIIEE